MSETFYNEILLEHNAHPDNMHDIEHNFSCKLTNSSCGDNLQISLLIENQTIKDAGFSGFSCAVSKASADILLNLIIGKKIDDLPAIKAEFEHMIRGEDFDANILDEAVALEDIKKMPARVKCATLAWQIIDKLQDED